MARAGLVGSLLLTLACGRSDLVLASAGGAGSASGTTGTSSTPTSSTSNPTTATGTSSTGGGVTSSGPLDIGGADDTADPTGVTTTGPPDPPPLCPGSGNPGEVVWDQQQNAESPYLDWRGGISAGPDGHLVAVGLIELSTTDLRVRGMLAEGLPWFEDTYDDGTREQATGVTHDAAGNAYVVGLWAFEPAFIGIQGHALLLLKYDPTGSREWVRSFPAPLDGAFGPPSVDTTDDRIVVAASQSDAGVVAIAVSPAGEELDRRTWWPEGFGTWSVAAVSGAGDRVAVAVSRTDAPVGWRVEVMQQSLLPTFAVWEDDEVPGAVADVHLAGDGAMAVVGQERNGIGSWWIRRFDADGSVASTRYDFDLELWSPQEVELDCDGNAVVSGRGFDAVFVLSLAPDNATRWTRVFSSGWAGTMHGHTLDALGDVSFTGRAIHDGMIDEAYVTKLAGG